MRDEPAPVLCEECGKAVVDADIDGKTFTVAQIITSGRKKYGKCLCMECYRKAAQTVTEEASSDDSDT